MSQRLDLWQPFKKEFELYFKRPPNTDNTDDSVIFALYTHGYLAGMQAMAEQEFKKREGS